MLDPLTSLPPAIGALRDARHELTRLLGLRELAATAADDKLAGSIRCGVFLWSDAARRKPWPFAAGVSDSVMLRDRTLLIPLLDEAIADAHQILHERTQHLQVLLDEAQTALAAPETE